MATVHYVTWDYPGLVFPEEKSESIATRDVEALTIPDGVYAFRFWDREERLTKSKTTSRSWANPIIVSSSRTWRSINTPTSSGVPLATGNRY
jgi:hypothetical protein